MNFDRQSFHAAGRVMHGDAGSSIPHPQFESPSDLSAMGKLKGKSGSKKRKAKTPKRRLFELGAAVKPADLTKDQMRIVIAALEPLGVNRMRIAHLKIVGSVRYRRRRLETLHSQLTEARERVDDLVRKADCPDEFRESAQRIVRKTLLMYIRVIEHLLTNLEHKSAGR